MTPVPVDTPPQLYHFADARQWAAQIGGGSYAPSGWESEGFIHCATAAQIAGVCERHLRGRTGLLKLTLSAAALGDSLRYEWSDASQNWYPHVYGRIDVGAVLSIEPFEP